MTPTASATAKTGAGPLLYAGSVAWSSALLFVVQPVMAKTLLPRFGGSASVWITCMLFFQVMLLAGYFYSFWLTRYLRGRTQALVHLAVLALSLAALPLRTRPDVPGANPTAAVLLLLASSVGLPFFVLSATSPLLQSWLVPRGHVPYRLFALSNAASLLALLAYPVVIEPFLPVRTQMIAWSAGYVLLLLLLGTVAAGTLRRRGEPHPLEAPAPAPAARSRAWLWVALAACGSTLWLAVANYLGQQVAGMPLIWVIPMTVYLLSFILCFEADGWYRPSLFRWLMPVAWIVIGSRIAMEGSMGGLRWELPMLSAALFVCCMFCHGELAHSKPAPRDGLAFYYLMVAAGGALGGVFVGLAAPKLFPTFLELPLGVTASVFLACYFLYGYRSGRRFIRLAVLAALAFVVSTRYQGDHSVLRTRSFYGPIDIRDSGAGDSAVRALYSGRTIHGLEFLSPALRAVPTTYYGAQSGAGRVFREPRAAGRHVAIIGLGTGTLAAYGRSGDVFRFYEINPAMVRAATGYFDFLRSSAAATDVVLGDGRLMLDREPPQSLDILVLDAFSDDAIPVHLLTRQAFAMYFDRLRPGGLLVLNLTNRYLDLGAEVAALAANLRKHVLFIRSTVDPSRYLQSAEWAIIASDPADLAPLRPYAGPPSERKVRPWTDDYTSILPLWR